MENEKKSFWKTVQSILVSIGSIVIGFVIGIICRGKLHNNGDGTKDAREQLENISRDSERLAETNRTTEEVIRKVRERKTQSTD